MWMISGFGKTIELHTEFQGLIGILYPALHTGLFILNSYGVISQASTILSHHQGSKEMDGNIIKEAKEWTGNIIKEAKEWTETSSRKRGIHSSQLRRSSI
jgi:hypothetical protein